MSITFTEICLFCSMILLLIIGGMMVYQAKFRYFIGVQALFFPLTAIWMLSFGVDAYAHNQMACFFCLIVLASPCVAITPVHVYRFFNWNRMNNLL